MSITHIEIENYKSIHHCSLSLKNINLLIGENGSGKSSILSALSYFYESLVREVNDEGAYNLNNKFSDSFKISITFNFSHLKNISSWNLLRNSDSEYSDYYSWIKRQNYQEVITLQKIKNYPSRWNRDKKYRQNIFNLFPLYIVNTRDVNLTDWSQLWDNIGDLVKVYQSKETLLKKALNDVIEDEKYKRKETFKKLTDAFAKANVKIVNFSPKQYASVMSNIIFNGREFESKNSKLEFLSDGTNSFNYTNLLIEILKLICELKMKSPIVLLDEPELSLHHKLIDQLTERLFDCEGKPQFLIATHSPRLLKNTLKNEKDNCSIFHVSNTENRTLVSEVSLFTKLDKNDIRPRIFMTDQHANAYFSRFILSVEGESEIELFSNRYLSELFPCMKNIDVMQGMSNDVIQKIISPKQRHFPTQFLLLVDMDKAIQLDATTKKFKIRNTFKKYISERNENYLYTRMRNSRLIMKKRIKAMSEKCKFHYWYPFLSSTDSAYSEFISLIKEYLLVYNIFVTATTIEGVLINSNNYSRFWDFYKNYLYVGDCIETIESFYDSFLVNDKLNFLRLIMSGKSDFILNIKEIYETHNKRIDHKLYELILQNKVDKTCGWMGKWLSYSLCSYFNIDSSSNDAYRRFKSYNLDVVKRNSAKLEFANHFPELFLLISKMDGKINQRNQA